MNNEVLKQANILWKRHLSNDRYYYYNADNTIVLLRINNFPDEPLLTLINELNIEDIEDRPSGWEFEDI